MGYTLKDKFEVLAAIRKCGFLHQIIEAFGSGRRLDAQLSFKKKKIAKIRRTEPSMPFQRPIYPLMNTDLCARVNSRTSKTEAIRHSKCCS